MDMHLSHEHSAQRLSLRVGKASLVYGQVCVESPDPTLTDSVCLEQALDEFDERERLQVLVHFIRLFRIGDNVHPRTEDVERERVLDITEILAMRE